MLMLIMLIADHLLIGSICSLRLLPCLLQVLLKLVDPAVVLLSLALEHLRMLTVNMLTNFLVVMVLVAKALKRSKLRQSPHHLVLVTTNILTQVHMIENKTFLALSESSAAVLALSSFPTAATSNK